MGLILKLDDGSVIGRGVRGGASADVERLPFSKAAEVGLAGEKDVQRLEALLEQAEALVKAAGGAVAQALPAAAEEPPAKRARMEPGVAATPTFAGNWYDKALSILEKIGSHMREMKPTLWMQVSKKQFPDYYNIIKEPLFFSTIENRLSKHMFATPSEFHNDVKHSFKNVYQYNPAHDSFCMRAKEAERLYDDLWQSSGLQELADSGTRLKRLAALSPATLPSQERSPPQQPARSRGAGGGQKKSNKRKSAQGHEASSGAVRSAPAFITDARKEEMGQLLMSDAFEPHMEALLDLIPRHLLDGGDGEFELDLSILDQETLQRIDALIRRVVPAGTTVPADDMEDNNGLDSDGMSDYD